MNNTSNLKDDGSRWTMLDGWSPETVFRRWGATAVYKVPDMAGPLRSGGVWMIRLEDGWHYAHADGNTSCYAGKQNFGDLPNGACAWAAHGLTNAQSNKASAERNLQEAIELLRQAENEYAAALAEAKGA